jgi:hypothetical protein
MIAGPTSATAATNVPGQIVVGWREVTGAARYRITRSSTKPEPEITVTEQPVSGFWCESGMCNWTNAPVELPWTYTYKVYALVPNSTEVSPCRPQPTASTTSITGPTGLGTQ